MSYCRWSECDVYAYDSCEGGVQFYVAGSGGGRMKRVEVPRSIEPWRIVCAAQSEPDYSEERQILCYASERDAYHDGGPFVLIEGGHCSCYDWEDVEWYATEYTRDEIETLAKSKVGGDGCYYESERKFWESVCLSLGIEVDG